MSGTCQISGRATTFGHNVSHSKRRTNRAIRANIQRKRIWVPELDRFIRLDLSTHAIRTIDKKGLHAYLKSEGITLKELLPRER